MAIGCFNSLRNRGDRPASKDNADDAKGGCKQLAIGVHPENGERASMAKGASSDRLDGRARRDDSIRSPLAAPSLHALRLDSVRGSEPLRSVHR